MTHPIPERPLDDTEIDELDHFLLYADVPESMTLDMLDGYLHALAVGPARLEPREWVPRIWGEDGSDMTPAGTDVDEVQRILGLVMRLFDSIVARLDDPQGAFMVPLWSTFQEDGVERDDAQIWAHGFLAGVQLRGHDWEPLLATEQGQAWLRPIRLLGEEDFAPERGARIATAADREALSLEIPQAVLAMHQYWLNLPGEHARAISGEGERLHKFS